MTSTRNPEAVPGHSREGGNPGQARRGAGWIPAFAGMTASVALAAAALMTGAAWAGTRAPVLDAPRGERCVEDVATMRRSHMDFLRHQRDETVHRGIRGARHSLAGCIECHANAKDGSVLGSPSHFCQGCHAYAAVKLDCFECHASRTRAAQAGRTPGTP